MPSAKTIRLSAGEATAEISSRGAEPTSWRVGGRELLWSGDPAHWDFHAPVLFPRVGASRDGVIRVDCRDFEMPQHGFARRAAFEIVEREEGTATLRLVDGPESRVAYPFGFSLDVSVTLAPDRLSLAFAVRNTGDGPMPYAIGFHPAFPWPLDGAAKDGHRVVFDEGERTTVPAIAPGGLLARTSRSVPLEGRALPLDPALFSEALVFLDARSRGFALEAPSGAAIRLEAIGMPHLAIWSRPDAPFLSLEAWSGHADWEDAEGELAGRASMIVLGPDEGARHEVAMTWTAPR